LLISPADSVRLHNIVAGQDTGCRATHPRPGRIDPALPRARNPRSRHGRQTDIAFGEIMELAVGAPELSIRVKSALDPQGILRSPDDNERRIGD
jgi:hypothetical protein